MNQQTPGPRILLTDVTPGQIDPDRVDRRNWYTNQELAQLEAQRSHAGQSVAWWPDGARVFAVGPDSWTLWCYLEAQGWDPSAFVYDDIPQVYLGCA